MPKNSTADKENNGTTTARCVWTDADDAILVRVLKEQKDLGFQQGAGWKRHVWTTAEAVLKAEGVSKGGPKVASKIQDHFTNLKKNFLEVHQIRNASGFGWDEGTKKAVATEEVWQAYIKAHPTYARWKDTPFPLYDDMHYLVHGIVATGASAFHPGQSPAPSAMSTGSDTGTSTQATPDAYSGIVGSRSSSSSSLILRDEVANDIDSDQLVAVDRPPSSQPSQLRKRERAPTDSPSPSVKRHKKGRRNTSQATSISGVAEALSQISQVLQAGGGVATPVRCKQAIQLVAEDGEYSSEEEDMIMDLFTRDMAVVDTYASIPKKTRRVKYLRGQLEKNEA